MLIRLLQLTQFTEFITHSTYFFILVPIAVSIVLSRLLSRELMATITNDFTRVWALCISTASNEAVVQRHVGMFTVTCSGHIGMFNVSPSPRAYRALNLFDILLVGATMGIYLSLRYAVIRASVPLVRGIAAAIRTLLLRDVTRGMGHADGKINGNMAPALAGSDTDPQDKGAWPGEGDAISRRSEHSTATYKSNMFDNTLLNIAQIIEKSTSYNARSAAPTLEEVAIQMLTEKTMLYKEALFCYTVPEVISEIDCSLDKTLDSVTTNLRNLTPTAGMLGRRPHKDFNTIEQIKINLTQNVIRNNGVLKSHATIRFATIMFCDIKGFTSLSDKMPLTHLLKLLEQFFAIVCEETERFNGKLGAYLGDGVMCIWEASSPKVNKIKDHDDSVSIGSHTRSFRDRSSGDFVRVSDHHSIDNTSVDQSTLVSDVNSTFGSSMHKSLAFSSTSSSQFFDTSLARAEDVRDSINGACLAALAILRRIQQSESPDVRKLDCRFGINAGDCVVGVFGCSKRLNYTAISDTVNVASRIETATRIFNSKILVHSNCVQYLGPKIKSRLVGQIEAKGKLEPLNLYEIMESTPKYHELINITLRVQLLFEAGKVFDCLQLCYRALNDYPGDEIIRSYILKCVQDLKSPQIYTPF